MKIAIVDYGMGNLHSVIKALDYASTLSQAKPKLYLATDNHTLNEADKVVFPGQGAMPDCMNSLRQSGMHEALFDALKHKPFLGICVGAQLLFDHSEEGDATALGFLPGKVRRFRQIPDQPKIKIPHMGWNNVSFCQNHPLLNKITDHSYFYFVHSYYFVPARSQDIIATSSYPNDFACIVAHKNIFATQFHPEKSHDNGIRLLANFIDWDGSDSYLTK